MLPVCYGTIDSYHKCSNKACLEGTDVNFTVVINNNLNEPITVDDIYIRDVETGRILAIDVNKEKIILKGEQKEFVLPSTILAPIQGYTFYYIPCFQAKAFNETDLLGQRAICGKTIRSLTVVPLAKVECRTDHECGEDSYCNTNSLYKCRPLTCLDNQTIAQHKCSDLRCNMIQYAGNHECNFNLPLILGLALLSFIVVALAAISRSKKKIKHK